MYSRVPNTTVGNPYSFFCACPSYMALFGTSRLLNFKKSSFLHFYSELLAYWFFPCTTLQSKVFVSNNWWSKSLLTNIWFLTLKKQWQIYQITNQKLLNWTPWLNWYSSNEVCSTGPTVQTSLHSSTYYQQKTPIYTLIWNYIFIDFLEKKVPPTFLFSPTFL